MESLNITHRQIFLRLQAIIKAGRRDGQAAMPWVIHAILVCNTCTIDIDGHLNDVGSWNRRKKPVDMGNNEWFRDMYIHIIIWPSSGDVVLLRTKPLKHFDRARYLQASAQATARRKHVLGQPLGEIRCKSPWNPFSWMGFVEFYKELRDKTWIKLIKWYDVV